MLFVVGQRLLVVDSSLFAHDTAKFLHHPKTPCENQAGSGILVKFLRSG